MSARTSRPGQINPREWALVSGSFHTLTDPTGQSGRGLAVYTWRTALLIVPTATNASQPTLLAQPAGPQCRTSPQLSKRFWWLTRRLLFTSPRSRGQHPEILPGCARCYKRFTAERYQVRTSFLLSNSIAVPCNRQIVSGVSSTMVVFQFPQNTVHLYPGISMCHTKTKNPCNT